MNINAQSTKFLAGYTAGKKAITLHRDLITIERRRGEYDRNSFRFPLMALMDELRGALDVYGYDIGFDDVNDTRAIFDTAQEFIEGAFAALFERD